MAVEKVGVYRKWLEPVPERNGKPIPKSEWPKKRRHRWIVRWYGTNAKRYGKVFKTRKEAERHALEFQNCVNLGKAYKPKKITLEDFIREHKKVMKGQVAYATLQDQLRALRLFENYIGGSIVLHKIRPCHAEAFIAYRLASGLRTATVNKDIRTLRRIFNLAIEPREYLRKGQNPFAKIKQRKRTKKPRRYVSIEQYRSLTKKAGDIWWKALLAIAYGSGLRRGEILNLTWVDIDFENYRIHIEPKCETNESLKWEPKDHENRVVPMSDESAHLLANLQARAKEGFPYVFISPERFKRICERRKNGKWNPRSEIINNLRKNFDSLRRRAGVSKCTLHDLRRSAITNWAQKLPMQVVQQLAGHSDISTTREYYLVVRPEDIASANNILNSILGRE